jgi:thiamine biosynthesis lipoprotein
MGSEAEVVLHRPGPVRTADVLDRLADLEDRWSRFRPGSELSRVNAAAVGPAGAAAVVSPETAALVQRLLWGWSATDGRFDPTVSLRSLGYDRDLAAVRAAGPTPVDPCLRPGPAPGCDGVRIDAATSVLRLPHGVALDPGGCGKGLAADLAALEAVDAGAAGALVVVGGDLRAAGEPPAGGWEVDVDHGVGGTVPLTLSAGALATSSTLRRRWRRGHGPAAEVVHHVVDPATGRPTTGRVVAVTVLAPEAWLAEVLATALLVADGGTLGPVDRCWTEGCAALMTNGDGACRRLGGFPIEEER